MWLEVEDGFLTDHLKFNYLASQHFIQQNSKGPPVHRLSIGLISNDLENRRHPIRVAGSPCGAEFTLTSKEGGTSRGWRVSGMVLTCKVTVADTVPL